MSWEQSETTFEEDINAAYRQMLIEAGVSVDRLPPPGKTMGNPPGNPPKNPPGIPPKKHGQI